MAKLFMSIRGFSEQRKITYHIHMYIFKLLERCHTVYIIFDFTIVLKLMKKKFNFASV